MSLTTSRRCTVLSTSRDSSSRLALLPLEVIRLIISYILPESGDFDCFLLSIGLGRVEKAAQISRRLSSFLQGRKSRIILQSLTSLERYTVYRLILAFDLHIEVHKRTLRSNDFYRCVECCGDGWCKARRGRGCGGTGLKRGYYRQDLVLEHK